MKPTKEPWVVPKGQTYTCPVSSEEFDEGERVFQGTYYQQVGRDESLYEHRPELGVFTVPASCLRAGGSQDPVPLSPYEGRAAGRRAGNASANEGRFFNISDSVRERIMYLIDHIYKDKE